MICLKCRSKFSTGYFFLDSPHQRNRIFLPATTSSLLLGVIAKRTREKRFTVSSNPVSHSIVCSNLSSMEHTHTHTHTHAYIHTGRQTPEANFYLRASLPPSIDSPSPQSFCWFFNFRITRIESYSISRPPPLPLAFQRSRGFFKFLKRFATFSPWWLLCCRILE